MDGTNSYPAVAQKRDSRDCSVVAPAADGIGCPAWPASASDGATSEEIDSMTMLSPQTCMPGGIRTVSRFDGSAIGGRTRRYRRGLATSGISGIVFETGLVFIAVMLPTSTRGDRPGCAPAPRAPGQRPRRSGHPARERFGNQVRRHGPTSAFFGRHLERMHDALFDFDALAGEDELLRQD